MPKKVRNFRLSDEALANLQKYTSDHKLENTTEALEQILSETKAPEPSPSKTSGASDPLLKCRRRILLEGDYLCVNKPPKAVELLSLEVCNVCKSLGIGLRDSTKIDIPTEETFDRGRQPVTDPTRTDMKTAGMVWCPEGMWVFPAKCDRCRAKNSGYWLNCQKQKLREKGEQQRQSTASKPS